METVRRPRHRAALAITIAGGALAIILVGCAGSHGTPSTSIVAGSGPSSSPIPTPAAVSTAAPSVASTPGGPAVIDTRTKADYFALPMKATLPVGWKPLFGIVGSLGIVHTGYPAGPDSTWWGPDILLVEDAQIHDASDVVSSEPAPPDRSRFVAWPADFFAYITALPGVKVVSGPEPITIGGVTGTQIAVMTPPMHPLVWLKGDNMWIGGGGSGVDAAAERRFAVVKTGGHTLFVTLAEDPAKFEARDAEVRAILDSITFE